MGSGLNKDLNFDFLKKMQKVKTKELILFYKQLSVMLASGIGITDSFEILIEESDDKSPLRDILEEVLEDIESGSKMSEALERHPKVFKNYEVSIIESGEATGRLDEVLGNISDELESNSDIFGKVKSALAYPVFVVATMFVVFFIMIVFILPEITSMMSEFNGDLPLPTKVIMAVSNFCRSNILLILVFIVLVIIFILRFRKTEKGELFFDRLKIKLPIFKNIFKKIYIVRFSRSFYTLLKSGISVNEALKICANVVDNKVYKEAIENIVIDVENGENMSSSLEKYKDIFPTIFIKMISIGEKTGELDELVNKTSSYFTKELQNVIGSLVSLIEPIIIVILGIGVAIIVAAILLPMYSLSSQF